MRGRLELNIRLAGGVAFSNSLPVYCSTVIISLHFPCRKQFNIAVLHQFVQHHKFHGLDLVAALRYSITSCPACCPD